MRRSWFVGFFLFFFGILAGVTGILWWTNGKPAEFSPLGEGFASSKRPLDAYTIDALSKRTFASSPITFGEPTATASTYIVRPFSFLSDGKNVTGQAHIPMTSSSKKMPVILQMRGFVDHSIYAPGVGTQRSAEVFAANGFLTLAPDFLGYGGSDMPSTDVFEERFQTYTTALQLLASVPTIPFADSSHIFLWGHSNGGHIALTVLTITGKSIPTALWAPVSKPFPYSILYYTDEFDDGGKSLRQALAKFEAMYDTDLYSFPKYLKRINAPIELHQGTADAEVPVAWSSSLADQLKKQGNDVRFFTYPGADHNLTNSEGSWNTVVGRDIEFFRSFMK